MSASPVAGPSTLPALASGRSSPSSSNSPNSDRSQSTPPLPSPVLSAGGDGDPLDSASELDSPRSRDLGTLGTGIGFGNTAWTQPGVRHTFATGNSNVTGMPSPPDSEEEYERERAQRQQGEGGGKTASSGLGEEYQMVRPGSGASEEGEMVSVPRRAEGA